MKNFRPYLLRPYLLRPYLLLTLILLLGTALRFWNLDAKPVWLDEVITALFSLGRDFYAVPLDRAFPLTELTQIFSLNPETTCPQIVQTVSTQSVHPPLFFCWMHDWMTWTNAWSQSWIWKLRALPALIGVVAIAAIYQLNRVAFSQQAGLAGAAAMAVSPFAVYLSQEARHYTLPMLLVILALLGLQQLHIDLYRHRFRPAIWLGWIVVNSLGFYVHYFFLLVFAAQVITLVVNTLSLKYLPSPYPPASPPSPPLPSLTRSLMAIALATLAVCLTYLPWLPTLISHLSRPETDWLQPTNPTWLHAIAPLYQLPLGWILMVIALPVENQPLWVAVLSGVISVLFVGWLVWQLSSRFGRLWSAPETHLPARVLVLFLLTVLLEFLAIVYLLGKDLTQVPRYNFIYYPAVCALLGASLVQKPAANQKARISNRGVMAAVLLAGVLSSGLVVSNQVFQKPYLPEQVAQTMQVEPDKPLIASLAYMDLQDVALGLSFALSLPEQADGRSQIYFALLARTQGYERVWQAFTKLNHPLPFPLNLWLIGPGLRRTDYPAKLTLAGKNEVQNPCSIDPQNYHRLGVPYQMYRCGQN